MIAALLGTLLVVLAIGALRLHPFLALIAGAVLAGSLGGSELPAAARVVESLDRTATAFGEVAGAIGIAIALAAIIGDCLLKSGAADRIAGGLLAAFGERRAAWALAAAGYVLSIPVFFDTVFFLLIPLARALARRMPGRYPLFVTAICAGAVATHSLVPPTPGPLGMADALGLDPGVAVAFGFGLGLLPVAFLLALAPRWLPAVPPPGAPSAGERPPARPPGLAASLFPVVLPVALMTGASAATALGDPGAAPGWIHVLGHRNAALFLAAVAAALVLRRARCAPLRELAGSFGGAVAAAGPIILITAAGGAFGRALADSGISDVLAAAAAPGSAPALILLAAGTAAALKLAQGSGTVAILTASALIASLLDSPAGPAVHSGYVYGAIGFGSMIGSWMNDSGFWVVGRMAGLDESRTLRVWSLPAAAVGMLGVVQILLLSAVLPLR